MYRNIDLLKTQGLPLVLTSPKPKVHPWYTFLQSLRSALGTYFYVTQCTSFVCSHVATMMTIVKGPSSTKPTVTPLFGKTFNQVKAHTHFSQPSEEYFCRSRRPTNRLHDKTFNPVQLTLIPHNHQRRNSVGQATYIPILFRQDLQSRTT